MQSLCSALARLWNRSRSRLCVVRVCLRFLSCSLSSFVQLIPLDPRQSLDLESASLKHGCGSLPTCVRHSCPQILYPFHGSSLCLDPQVQRWAEAGERASGASAVMLWRPLPLASWSSDKCKPWSVPHPAPLQGLPLLHGIPITHLSLSTLQPDVSSPSSLKSSLTSIPRVFPGAALGRNALGPSSCTSFFLGNSYLSKCQLKGLLPWKPSLTPPNSASFLTVQLRGTCATPQRMCSCVCETLLFYSCQSFFLFITSVSLGTISVLLTTVLTN